MLLEERDAEVVCAVIVLAVYTLFGDTQTPRYEGAVSKL